MSYDRTNKQTYQQILLLYIFIKIVNLLVGIAAITSVGYFDKCQFLFSCSNFSSERIKILQCGNTL